MTAQQALAIERMWAEGVSGKEIARRIGIERQRVYEYANTHRWSCPKRKGRESDRAEIVKRLALEGCTYRDVMRELGLSKQTACRCLTSARLELGI